MGRTANTLPRFDTNLQKGDAISAAQWNALASLLNGIKAFDGIWIKATANGLHIGGGGGGGSSFPWDKLAFGYALAFDSETTETTCTIYPGEVRMQGLRTYALEAATGIVLTGVVSVVHLEIDRVSHGTGITVASALVAETDGSTMRLPLFTFTQKGAGYELTRIHHMGDFDFAAPVR